MTGHFEYGVASGDPLHDRVILWTRVPKEMQVKWEIALDKEFKNIIQSGIEAALAKHDLTIHADPAPLEPATIYFYRFHADGGDLTHWTHQKSLKHEAALMKTYPHLQWCDLDSHGYNIVDVTPNACKWNIGTWIPCWKEQRIKGRTQSMK